MDLKRAFSKDEEIIDSITPLYVQLSAKYLRSFAYYTVNTRLPVILTKVIDHLARDKDQIVQVHGADSAGELKDIIGYFSKLKNELQTNKPFTALTGDGQDVSMWNKYLEERREKENDGPRWYSTIWLYAECYLYRRFREPFELSTSLKAFDPFRKQKEQSFHDSLAAMTSLAAHLLRVTSDLDQRHLADTKKALTLMLHVALWANSCDLSISLGEVSTTADVLHKVDEMNERVLVDHSDAVWTSLLATCKGSPAHIAIICDNAGFEAFADLCLADFLLTFSLADCVTFHLKALPWFVSDTMPHDFHWLLGQLSNLPSPLGDVGQRWTGYLASGQITVEADPFWTSPFHFSAMPDLNPCLYARLAASKLVVVKGDLNYRKLLAETNCRPTKSFREAIGSFRPTDLVALRTVKCDLICGLPQDVSETLTGKDAAWMETGQYAVMQFDG